MNTRPLVAAAALALLGTSAFAGGEFDPLTGFGPVSTGPTRTSAPAAAPERFDAGTAYLQAPKAGATVTREAVRAEYLRARRDGELTAFDTGTEFAQAPDAPSTLTRAEVRAETLAALRAAR